MVPALHRNGRSGCTKHGLCFMGQPTLYFDPFCKIRGAGDLAAFVDAGPPRGRVAQIAEVGDRIAGGNCLRGRGAGEAKRDDCGDQSC
jgi:hypothetical protein